MATIHSRGLKTAFAIIFRNLNINIEFLDKAILTINEVFISELIEWSIDFSNVPNINIVGYNSTYLYENKINKFYAHFDIRNYKVPFEVIWTYKNDDKLFPTEENIDLSQLTIIAKILDVELLKEAILNPTKPASTYFLFTYPDETWIEPLWTSVFYDQGFDYFKITDEFIFATADKVKIELEKNLGIKFEKIKNKIWLNGKPASETYTLHDNHAELKDAEFDTIIHKQFPFTMRWDFKQGKKIIPSSTSINAEDFEITLIGLDAAGLKDALLKKPEIAKEFDYLGLKFKVRKHTIQLDAQRMDIKFVKLSKEEFEALKKHIGNVTNNWNSEAEAQNHDLGIIHNWDFKYKNSKTVEAYFDFGSSGIYGLTLILQILNDFEIVEVILK